jgi:hypothetical protein
LVNNIRTAAKQRVHEDVLCTLKKGAVKAVAPNGKGNGNEQPKK